MSRFEDLFVIQIIGLLKNRRFTGDSQIRLESLPVRLRFVEGALIDAFYKGLLRKEALEKILWACKGDLALVPQPYVASNWDYIHDMDDIIAQSSPLMPDRCPLMNSLLLEKGKPSALKPASTFAESEQSILDSLSSPAGIHSLQAQQKLSLQDFWKGLFHLLGSGQISGSYHQPLSLLLSKTQDNVIANLQKMLGKRVAELYHERLAGDMVQHWPNTPNHDPIYGTAPYRTWAKLLNETLPKAVPTAMGSACYKKAVAALKPEEAALFQQLISG